MAKFSRHPHGELLGFSRIVNVQDNDVWRHLVTPQVKALLGAVVEIGQPRLMETTAGLFPGDEVTNLNNHLLYGGQTGFVRVPYVSTLHRTAYGALVIKRDPQKLKVMAWVGDYLHGKAELVFISALRDRRFDGTRRANDSSLLFYPYDDPVHHRTLCDELRSLEVSIYSFLPGSRVREATGDQVFDEFIEKPFTFLSRPELFLELFARAWKTSRGPGQWAAPIPDVSRLAVPGFETIARRAGYDLLEGAVSHYHVARWFAANGYRYSFQKDADTLAQLTEGIRAIKELGIKLTRPQESWVCVIQSLRPLELIPAGLFLGGPVWPQDNISNELLWMNKPLTEAAAKLITGPLASAPSVPAPENRVDR